MIKLSEIEIINFKPQYSADFLSINVEWLDEFFYVEDYDREVLSLAEELIINAGGYILFAQYQSQIIGTVALIKRENGAYELSKMGIRKRYRGNGLGHLLMEAAIDCANTNEIKHLWLDSNRKLIPALHLYLKFGFNEIDVDPNTPYERCNIRMELFL